MRSDPKPIHNFHVKAEGFKLLPWRLQPDEAGCPVFVKVELIAAGSAPLDPAAGAKDCRTSSGPERMMFLQLKRDVDGMSGYPKHCLPKEPPEIHHDLSCDT